MTDDETPPELATSAGRRAHADDIPLHKLLQLEWERALGGDGTAEVRMPVQPDAFGFSANLHGGAIATMVDLACALAAVSSTDFDPTKQSLVTADMHVRYLGRAKTSAVVARAEVVRAGSTLIVVECKVADEDGNLVASADFSMMIVDLRLPLSQGGHRGEPGDPEL